MSNERRRYDAGFKAKVALEAVKGMKTIAEISSEYKIHSSQINGWKKVLQAGTVGLFQEGRNQREESRNEELVDRVLSATVHCGIFRWRHVRNSGVTV